MSPPIDYSKWDAIELSDDEDFECHPNVDKASMVRWKQAEVHRKRKEQKDKLAILALESGLNDALIQDLQSLLSSDGIDSNAINMLKAMYASRLEDMHKSVATIITKDRDPRWQEPICDAFVAKRLPILDILVATSKATSAEHQVKVITAGIQALSARQADLQAELAKEKGDMESKVTMDTLKEGFSKSSISKGAPGPKPSTSKTIKVIHNPASSSDETNIFGASRAAEPHDQTLAPEHGSVDEDEEDEEVYIKYPPLIEFAKFSPQQLDASFAYIQSHHDLLSTEDYTDQVLAEAFKQETLGFPERARACVHQALLLQYCRQLDLTSHQNGAALFFSKIKSPEHRARIMFTDDVKTTYSRIAARVKVLAAEERERSRVESEAAQKRLQKCVQPDGSLRLPLSDPPTEEELNSSKVFDSFPRDFQEALILQDIDKINAYLSTLSREEGEEVVEKCGALGLLTLGSE